MSALTRGFVESLLREFPEFSVEQAVRLERRLRLEDAAWMAEQTMAEIDALPTVKP